MVRKNNLRMHYLQVIFIDEIDVLGPSRDRSQGISKAASRLVATLAGELDSLYGYPVMVVGATNRKESLDESLRRPRRLEKEIEIGVPDPNARFEILDSLFGTIHNSLSAADIRDVATRAHGFVGADLRQLASEASMIALRRCVKDGADAVVTRKDVEVALYHTKPSALREFSSDIPNVRLSDVGGNADLKQKLREAVEWPIKFKDQLHSMGAVPPKGILLWGPPGCSKTLMVKAIAGECRLNFFSVKGPELISKYVGESEKAISNIFEKARKASPAILFFDEIDGLVGARSQKASDGVDVSERVLSQMLQEMDGVKVKDDQIVVIGATNRMDRLDKALLRPGRFDRILQVCLPDDNDRKEILSIHLRHIPLDNTVQMESLVKATEGCSGAEIASICQQAAMHALTSAALDMECTHVSQNDFDAVTTTIKIH
jgi:AAA family ATPase